MKHQKGQENIHKDITQQPLQLEDDYAIVNRQCDNINKSELL